MEGEKHDDICKSQSLRIRCGPGPSSRHTSDDENNKRDDRTPVLDLAGIEIRHSVNRPCMNPFKGLLETQGFPPRFAFFELGALRPDAAVIEIRCTKDCKCRKRFQEIGISTQLSVNNQQAPFGSVSSAFLSSGRKNKKAPWS